MKKGRAQSAAAVQRDYINREMEREVVALGSDPRFVIQRIDSGSLTVNRILGGGFPRGRHIELFGDWGALKTTIVYMTVALAQQRGELCMYVDGENSFDPDYFRHFGGVPEDLMMARPRTAEEAIKILTLFADKTDENPGGSIVAVDSVASMLPLEELQKDVEEGDARTAGRARMMSRWLRIVTAVNENTIFLWTNQTIDSVGGYGGRTTPGGRALKFYASVRIEMKNEKREKKGRKKAVKNKMVQTDMTVGKWVVIRAEKQKTARPETTSMFYFDFDKRRIDRAAEIITLGMDDGLITRSGNTFSYEDSGGDVWSGQYAHFKKILEREDELREELEWAINEATRVQADPMSGEDNDDDED